MGIAELATRLLADPESGGQQPPMDEGDVRSQLYGRFNASKNVTRIRPERSGNQAAPGRNRPSPAERRPRRRGDRATAATAAR